MVMAFRKFSGNLQSRDSNLTSGGVLSFSREVAQLWLFEEVGHESLLNLLNLVFIQHQVISWLRKKEMSCWPRQPISSCKEQEKRWPSRTKASELWELGNKEDRTELVWRALPHARLLHARSETLTSVLLRVRFSCVWVFSFGGSHFWGSSFGFLV